MVGASAHRVALDNVEVLEVDQWLALLIIGDLAPYTQPVTGPELLPTRSAKSRLSSLGSAKPTTVTVGTHIRLIAIQGVVVA